MALRLVEELQCLLGTEMTPGLIHGVRRAEILCRLADFFRADAPRRPRSPKIEQRLIEERSNAAALCIKGPFVEEALLRRFVEMQALGPEDMSNHIYAAKVRYLTTDDDEQDKKKELWDMWREEERKAWKQVRALSSPGTADFRLSCL